MSIITTVIVTGVVLWFAHGWYLNERLKLIHYKLDYISQNFNGLREYLYELDPQFDDERDSIDDVFSEDPSMFSGVNDMELMRKKESGGYRTLNTTFLDGGFRAPNR